MGKDLNFYPNYLDVFFTKKLVYYLNNIYNYKVDLMVINLASSFLKSLFLEPNKENC